MARYPAKSLYVPRNPAKYMGNNRNNITMRSSWERLVALEFDNNPAVIGWTSETVKIAYFHPIDLKWTIYKPDFMVIYIDAVGKRHTEIIEVKPSEEDARQYMQNPTIIGSKNPGKLKLLAAKLAVNAAKWKAAIYYCQRNGWQFRVLTGDKVFDQKFVRR
jgi:hypothetical protein